MDVLHVIGDLEEAGAELFLERLVASLNPKYFRHCVVSLQGIGTVGIRLQDACHEVRALNGTGVTLPLRLLHLRNFLRLKKPDIIQGWMYNGNLAASIGRRLAGLSCPVVWAIRHSLDAWSSEPLDTRCAVRLSGWLSKTPGYVIFNSQRAVAQHHNHGFSNDKAVVIPNGFDTKRFSPDSESRSHMRRQLGLHDDHVVVGTLGRFHALKNQIGFIQAAGIIHHRYPALRFLMAGPGVTSDNSTLVRLIHEFGLNNCVTLLGEVTAVPALLNALDIFVSPSLAEGFPNVVGEAMACGKPCIVTDAGASAELVAQTGRVVPSQNSMALADAVSEIVTAGKQHWDASGTAARQRIMDEYSMEKVAGRYAALYEQVALL